MGAKFPRRRRDERGAAWRRSSATRVLPRLGNAQAAMLQTELDDRDSFALDTLPGGVIHADLFRDNALFEGPLLTGIIDFYYAHHGAFIYDLAVLVADWCFGDTHIFDLERARHVISGYREVRSLHQSEQAAWINSLRAAGLRFWLSRLVDALYPRDGALTHVKDPGHFEALIRYCHEQPSTLELVWA